MHDTLLGPIPAMALEIPGTDRKVAVSFMHKLVNNYPLTRAILALTLGDRKLANDTLATLQPETALDSLCRQVLLLRAKLEDPESSQEDDRETCLDWITTTFPALEGWFAALETDREKSWAYGALVPL